MLVPVAKVPEEGFDLGMLAGDPAPAVAEEEGQADLFFTEFVTVAIARFESSTVRAWLNRIRPLPLAPRDL